MPLLKLDLLHRAETVLLYYFPLLKQLFYYKLDSINTILFIVIVVIKCIIKKITADAVAMEEDT